MKLEQQRLLRGARVRAVITGKNSGLVEKDFITQVNEYLQKYIVVSIQYTTVIDDEGCLLHTAFITF